MQLGVNFIYAKMSGIYIQAPFFPPAERTFPGNLVPPVHEKNEEKYIKCENPTLQRAVINCNCFEAPRTPTAPPAGGSVVLAINHGRLEFSPTRSSLASILKRE